MPKIIPIRELKNTATISKFVEDSCEPVFVTKNGYGSMVIMSMEVYEREFARNQQQPTLFHIGLWWCHSAQKQKRYYFI